MLTDQKVLLSGSLLLFPFILYHIHRAKQVWQAFETLPARSLLFSPLNVFTRLLPRIPWISDGLAFSGENVFERVFVASDSDIVQLRSLFPLATPQLVLADATAAKTILQSHGSFPKSVPDNKAVLKAMYGPSIAISEHHEWRKHRRIAGPSFSESNNVLVWESTIKVILGYFIKWNRDGRGSIINVSDFMDVTTQIAFMVFSTAGFGIEVDWDWDKNEIPNGHTMHFVDALTAVTQCLSVHMFPRWLLSFNKRGREAVRAHDELEKYMLEMIKERSGSAALEGKRDLLTNLVNASMEKNDPQKDFGFTDRDLLGNIFIFLFAGHESTSSTLSFAIALLALHQEEQEELYKHVRSVVPDGRLPTHRDVPRLTRVLAVINETLRLYAPATQVMKKAAEDCVIQTDSGKPLPVPKGTLLVPMISAIHHNPKYWPDPYEFRPDRFLGAYNRDAFLPFSVGARACIGRRFAEIEIIAVLSVIILYYKITVLDEPQYAHETAVERKKRVLASDTQTLVKPVRTPVVFTPREGADIPTD